MAKRYNSVPLGQAGTGDAFVLGGSQAANQVIQDYEYNQRVAQQEAALRQKQAQDLANTWQQNALKLDGGLYWQPEFNQRYQQHLDKGIQLRQMGVNPWNYNANDPVQTGIAQNYLLERQQILADTQARKALESQAVKNLDLIRKNPNNYYQGDIQKFNEYLELPFSEARNQPIPVLGERFNNNAVLAKVIPSEDTDQYVRGNERIKITRADKAATRTSIVSAYNNTPESARWVDELTGSQGLSISQLERIPNTKEGIKSNLERDYTGNPQLRTQLAQQGITPNSDKYKEFIKAETDRLYGAKTAWNNQIESDLAQVLPKVKETTSVLPDYTAERMAMARERLSLARQANDRVAKNALEKGSDAEIYRQDLVKRILSGTPDSFEEVAAQANAKGKFGTDRLAVRNNPDGSITFRIPPVTALDSKGGAVVKRNERNVTINPSSPTADVKMNELINELTDETVNISKFKTGNASGKTRSTTAKPKTTTKNNDPLGIL